MVEEFFRELTHDNDLFDQQWSNVSDRLENVFFDDLHTNKNNPIGFKTKTLDCLVDYILAEPNPSEKKVYSKQLIVERILQVCADDSQPPLSEIVRVLRRIIDLPDIYNQWYLTCIQTFQYKFRLYEQLISSKSVDLIESILQSLEKHSFLNGQVDKQTEEHWTEYLSRRLFSPLTMDSNKLNREDLMLIMRPAFQKFFR